MTEETWILEQCRRPKRYGTLGDKSQSESSGSFFNYVVEPNDTLISIAVKNEVSVCFHLLLHIALVALFNKTDLLTFLCVFRLAK